MDRNQDWSALAAEWQGQDTPTVDIDAIREEAARRSRGLRRTIVVEVGFSLLVIAVCALIALSPRSDGFEKALFGGMTLFLVAYQALMVWIRRRDLAAAGSDALSLVEREIQRANTVLRYWRWGMWSALALWIAIYALMLHGMGADWPLSRVSGMLGGTAINVVMFPAIGLYGWWRSQQARARLRRFGALREQLVSP